MTAPQGKRCPRCGQVKPADQFYRRRRRALRGQRPGGGGAA